MTGSEELWENRLPEILIRPPTTASRPGYPAGTPFFFSGSPSPKGRHMAVSPTISLRTAYLCLNCQLINQGAKQGKCQSCGSENVYPVSTLLTAYIKPTPSLRRPPHQPVRSALLSHDVHLQLKR